MLRGPELAKRTKALNEAEALHQSFLDRLFAFRVLDPACGSGNFLYLALLALKELEHRVNLEAEALGLPRAFPRVGPECVRGIELNPYAAELARVSVWIGEIQWMRRNGFEAARNPILRSLGTIECRDAIVNPDGTKAEWPEADVVIGNPPFLGDRKMKPELGISYVTELRKAYQGEVPGGADLVCYWFARGWQQIQSGKLVRAGLVSTNSVRGGANREVLKPIVQAGRISFAWDDEAWSVDGADVRVSLIGFDAEHDELSAELDGKPVKRIFSDLTASDSGVDITNSRRLRENCGIAFQGTINYGPFVIEGSAARSMLMEPTNPNGRPNSDVVMPWTNGRDITQRPDDRWIIFFSTSISEQEAAHYQAPFEHVAATVKPYRFAKDNKALHERWWTLWRSRPDMFSKLSGKDRQIVTPRVAKHRIFVWRETSVVVDSAAVSVARSDDTTFGILHSKFHEIWSLRMGTHLGVGNDPRYTPSSTFETFPFPEGLTPDIPASAYEDDPRAQKIAEAAKHLCDYRDRWLNPPELVTREPEVVSGYPERVLPKDAEAAKKLKKRTLTKLYNERPSWLSNAHRDLDEAVAEAYGWGDDWRAGGLDDDEVVARLFKLNAERTSSEEKAAAE